MIKAVRKITSENPSAEIWRYLRLFFNIEATTKTLKTIHGIKDSKHDRNLRKQAQQIGYCIRQAEQYFQAATDVGIATRPLLLYYGCVSLGRALILLKKDGNYSLDGLRKAKRHRHHGLDIAEGDAERASKTKTISEFFSALQCSVHLKDDGTPWGHFPLFYESLVPAAFAVDWQLQDADRITGFSRQVPQTSIDLQPLNHFTASPLSSLNILKSLPDLYWDLGQVGVVPDVARGNITRQTLSYYDQTVVGQDGKEVLERTLSRIEDMHDFFIDGLVPVQKAQLLTFLQSRNPIIQVLTELDSNIHLRLTVATQSTTKAELGYYPDIIDDINGKKFYIINSDGYIHEAAALLAVMFCLGMLSRYYPDVWMTTIEKNVEALELTTKLLGVVARKFPNLILDQMTGLKHYVHL